MKPIYDWNSHTPNVPWRLLWNLVKWFTCKRTSEIAIFSKVNISTTSICYTLEEHPLWNYNSHPELILSYFVFLLGVCKDEWNLGCVNIKYWAIFKKFWKIDGKRYQRTVSCIIKFDIFTFRSIIVGVPEH